MKMINTVPFKSDFKRAKQLDKWNNYFLYTSTFLLIAGFAIKKFPDINENYASNIETANAVLIVVIFILGMIVDFIYRNAENLRRLDLIDNSFGTRLSEKKSKDYYTNDDIKCGYKKVGVNNFESVFFTYRILKESINKERVKVGVIAILFFILAVYGYDKVFILVLQLSIPFSLISRLYKTEVLYCGSKSVCDNYRSIFDKADELNEIKFHAEIIKNLLAYESNLAWSNTLLDDKIYQKMNTSLSKEWDDIKVEYGLS
jgi:hypothetical protein